MDKIISTIRFVNAGLENPLDIDSSSHQVVSTFDNFMNIGDVYFWLVTIILALLLSAAYFLFKAPFWLRFENNKNSCRNFQYIKKLQSYNHNNFKHKRSFIFIIVLFSFAMIIFTLKGISIAQPNVFENTRINTEQKNVDVNNYLNVGIYQDTGNVKNIDDLVIKNNSDNTIQLKTLQIASSVGDIKSSWKVFNDKYVVYSNSTGEKFEIKDFIYLKCGEEIRFNVEVNIDNESAKSLIDKDAFNLNIEYENTSPKALVVISGIVQDINQKPISNVDVSFEKKSLLNANTSRDSNKQQTYNTGANATTDSNGKYQLEVEKGSLGYLKFEHEDYESSVLEILADKDKEIPVVTLAAAKIIAKVPKLADTTLTYNGQLQSGFADLGTHCHYEGSIEAVDANTYSSTFLLDEDAISWQDGSIEPKSYTWSIDKAKASLSMENLSIEKNTSNIYSLTYVGDCTETPTFTVSDESIVKVENKSLETNIQFKVLSFNKNGNATIDTVMPEGKNYTSGSCRFTIAVGLLYGHVFSLQNIPSNDSDKTITSRANIKMDLIKLDSDEKEVISSTVSGEDGSYEFSVDDKYLEVAFDGEIVIDVPGVNYCAESVKVDKAKSQEVNINNLTGFDFYTIEQLKQVSDLLGSGGASDSLKEEFNKYMNEDAIWLSNSNGIQPTEVDSDLSSADPEKCNQKYKNSFVIDESKIVPENQEIDQFLFLRIIGINQDKEAISTGQLTGKTAGLTLQTVRSLPRAYPFCGHEDVSWWGADNCYLRKDLSEDGEVIKNLNDNIKNTILPVQKKSQSTYDSKELNIQTTVDKLFIPSYTEMCTQGTEDEAFEGYQYYFNDSEGSQYQWYKNKQIKGNELDNEAIKDLVNVNSGEEIAEGNARTFQRTCYFDASTYFLTTNYRGSIGSYAQSKQRIGIAPAFSIGTATTMYNITLKGDNVDYSDAEDKSISGTVAVKEGDNFRFKVKAKEGKELESVKLNGEEITPVEGIYTVKNIVSDMTIISKTKGEKDIPILNGKIQFEKNIGNAKKTEDVKNKVKLSVLDETQQVIDSTTSDEKGNYSLSLSLGDIDKSVCISIDAMPGVNSYTGESFSIVEGTNQKDVKLHSLDAYTLDELKSVGTWLSENTSTDSECYKEFYSYIKNDTIWYCNSYGCQPSGVSADSTNNVDTSKCNQNYVNSFILDNDGNPDKSNVDNYIFLRIIGISHDDLSASSKKAGISFQTIHVLPEAMTMSSGDAQWWGSSELREKLQSGGEVYNKINSNIRSVVSNVNKQSQTIRQADPSIQNTDDSFFITSYSEMWNVNSDLIVDHSWYGNTGTNTEGYVYEWYKLQNIDGKSGNEKLKSIVYKNSGVLPSEKATSWERSVCCTGGNNYFMATDNTGSLLSSNFNFGTTGYLICFCL